LAIRIAAIKIPRRAVLTPFLPVASAETLTTLRETGDALLGAASFCSRFYTPVVTCVAPIVVANGRFAKTLLPVVAITGGAIFPALKTASRFAGFGTTTVVLEQLPRGRVARSVVAARNVCFNWG
jgi:hypothetical protein